MNNKKNIPCKFFRQGICQFGKNCWYSHRLKKNKKYHSNQNSDSENSYQNSNSENWNENQSNSEDFFDERMYVDNGDIYDNDGGMYFDDGNGGDLYIDDQTLALNMMSWDKEDRDYALLDRYTQKYM